MATLNIGTAVQAALRAGRPVVALESTIITHGLPRPVNLDTALAAEAAVRRAGAEPATIAIIDGRVNIGLEREQLERVATSERALKAGRTSLGHALALGKGWVAGTTVSGTMALAHRAGIRVFATGGIGGVHRGAESSMDISTDLVELGRTPVGVFCSGAKSILDIPRTLEYLETQGVPVLTFNPTGEFPAFYTARSGLHVPRVASPAEAAAVMAHNALLGLENGTLFGVPIPAEHEPHGAAIQAAVDTAVRESAALGIDRRGKEVTPWLLRRVAQLASQSVQSNIALVLNNARVAAQSAVELSRLTHAQSGGTTLPYAAHKVMVVGAAAVDVCANGELASRSTAPGTIELSPGGVARNVARAAHALRKADVLLVAPLARDALGRMLEDDIQVAGMRTDGLVWAKGRTPACSLLLARGDLVAGVADMDLTDSLTPDDVRSLIARFAPRTVAVDANVSPEVIAAVLEERERRHIRVVYEPTSVAKSRRLLDGMRLARTSAPRADVLTPNALELRYMASFLHRPQVDAPLVLDTLRMPIAEKQELVQDAAALIAIADTLFIKLGAHGVLVVWHTPAGLRIAHSPAPEVDPEAVVSTTGAGDTFTGAILSLLETHGPVAAAALAQRAAALTLYTKEAVSPEIRAVDVE